MVCTWRARTARALCVALLLLTPLGCTTKTTHVAYAIRYRGPGTPDCAAICTRYDSSQDAHSQCFRDCPGVEVYDGARCDEDHRRIIPFIRPGLVTPSWEPEQVTKLGKLDACVDAVYAHERPSAGIGYALLVLIAIPLVFVSIAFAGAGPR